VREASFSRPRNTAVAIDKDGSIMTTYAKMHLFSPSHEDLYFSRGDAPGIFSIGGLTLGIAICYDLRFAGLFRMYAKRGVHVVIVHAAWPGERQKYWELFITSRAAENQMYVVGVNTVGKTPAGRYSGSSMTADPSGTIISRAGSAEELIFSDISPAIVRKTRRDFPMEHDHRDLLYHSLLP
jgi:predicted amidohydrolase